MTELVEMTCGHPPTPDSGIGTGYARHRDGAVLCYGCADKRARAEMRTADAYTVYVNSTGTRITTWSGGVLGVITDYTEGKRVFTASGGEYRPVSIRAVTPDGARWWGRGTTSYDAITVRRCKTKS